MLKLLLLTTIVTYVTAQLEPTTPGTVGDPCEEDTGVCTTGDGCPSKPFTSTDCMEDLFCCDKEVLPPTNGVCSLDLKIHGICVDGECVKGDMSNSNTCKENLICCKTEPTTPGTEPTTPGTEPTTPGTEPTTPGTEEPSTPEPITGLGDSCGDGGFCQIECCDQNLDQNATCSGDGALCCVPGLGNVCSYEGKDGQTVQGTCMQKGDCKGCKKGRKGHRHHRRHHGRHHHHGGHKHEDDSGKLYCGNPALICCPDA